MSRLSSVAERHPLITFFVLTYALSWTFEIPLVVLGDGIVGTQGLVSTSSRPTSPLCWR